jgi:methyl-accepting chemotaxis protein
MRGAISEYAKLAAELRAQQEGIKQAVQHFNQLAVALQNRESLAGTLLFDPGPADELRAALSKVNASLDELHAGLRETRTISSRLPKMGADMEAILKNLRLSSVDARRLAASLPELEKSAEQAVDMLPGVILQSQETLIQIQRLTKALQRSWLVRGNLDQPGNESRLSTEHVGTDR